MWQPIPLSDLEQLIAQQLAACSSETRALYELNAVQKMKWSLSPWGDAGGGFWVIAVLGNTALWYNDIEEGFNTSTYVQEGTIENYWCNQDTLHQALLGLIQNSSTLGPPNATA